jgi:hypothetical protein
MTISMPLTEVGWHLITLPGAPLNPDPAAVFDELVALGQLSGALHRYVPGLGYKPWYENAPSGFGGPLQAGEGYWLYVYGAVTISYDASVTFAQQQVYLATAGWHLIGSGQTADIAMGNCTVRQDSGTAAPFANQTGLWIADPLYGWSITLGAYRTCGVAVNDNDNALRVFAGYWLYTMMSDVTLYVPAS